SATLCPIFALSARLCCVSTTVGELECFCLSAKICRFWRPLNAVSHTDLFANFAPIGRTYKNGAQQSASLALFQRVNRCAAQHWGQVLTLEVKICSLGRSFTIRITWQNHPKRVMCLSSSLCYTL